MMSFLHTYAPPWLSLMAGRCSIGETHQGLQGASAVTLPHGRDGPSVRRMAVLWTFRKSPICRPVHHQLMRKELHNVTTVSGDLKPYQYRRFENGQFSSWHP